MTSNEERDARTAAVEGLEALGVSSYAARTYVALVRLGEGTARDVSEICDVPRTRVYDAVEELHERGLVDVQQSTPQRFAPVSAETATRHFARTYDRRVERLRESLDAIEPAAPPREQRGVWTVTGREAVTDRVVEFIDNAAEEVVYMTVEDLLTEPVRDALRRAGERGVDIKLAEMADSVEQDLREEVPGAEPFESLWHWEDTPAGRLLMVDRERTLVSVLVEGNGDHPPEPRDETAVWGSGEANGLVVVLKAVFTWELDDFE